MNEPTHGSIVLVHGKTGTAFQRMFSDGLWHSVTGRVATWPEILVMPNVVMAYNAPEEN